ncbi:MAG: hypothetical protein VR70_08965 [Rhodospirillaceae bacterium BRH_c57]|nr:MAG: hypothetical protein VR70_08965 [Rhodospirillaceae bacterium BRH_c57]
MMTETVLDLRATPPQERHPTVFGTFDHLKAGESFTLVNDHDPMPLHLQFDMNRTGTFEWLTLEKGPEVWRVRVSKVEGSGNCCGGCGG